MSTIKSDIESDFRELMAMDDAEATPPDQPVSSLEGAFTPGPWLREGKFVYALQQDGWRHGEPVMVNRFSVYVQGNRSGGQYPPEDELEAVASLIAAAPALVEATRNLLGLFDNPIYRRRLEGDGFYEEAIEQARAALLQALGAEK